MTTSPSFADFQFGIYQRGLMGEAPSLPVSIEDVEVLARSRLSAEAYNYIAGGAGSEVSMKFNQQAFDRWRIVPRMMCDVAERDLSIRLFGTTINAPVIMAPIGVQSLAHPNGELEMAQAAHQLQIPYCYSSAATRSPEDVAAAAGACLKWFQLYWPRDQEITRSFIRRAEAVGYTALVVTLDTRMLAWRERDLNRAFLPFLKGEGIGLYLSDPVFRSRLEKPPEEDMPTAVLTWAAGFSDLSQTWDDIAFLKECTSLPIILKGILHPDDACRAFEHGADGIIVSNHGGRQVDGCMAALDALPGVVDAVGSDLPILFDSGIRRGADIFRALALGAKAVLVGRPYMWGLALNGADGIREVMQRILADFDITMTLCGCRTLNDVNREMLAAPRD
jgi:isopentenyl diphosphate isomerase/L-lactate dehydrogenase-like FMN-dependent dehydrogenase